MRYLPLTPDDRAAMLEAIGVAGIDALFRDVPAEKLLNGPLNLPRGRSEMEVERELGLLAARSTTAGNVPFFVGAAPIGTMCRRLSITSSSAPNS